MSRVFDAITDFFSQDEWKTSPVENRPHVLRVSFKGEVLTWNCYAQAREEQQQFVFYSVFPKKVPESRRMAMAEFLTRANYGMIIGCFELDFTDGEVRYKTSADFEDASIEHGHLKHLVYSNVLTMDRYSEAIEKVAEGLTPVTAIQLAEDMPTARATA